MTSKPGDSASASNHKTAVGGGRSGLAKSSGQPAWRVGSGLPIQPTSRNGGHPANQSGGLVAVVQHAYLRLLAGDSVDARQTLGRALASEGVALLASDTLNTVQFVKGIMDTGHAGSPFGRALASLHEPGDASVTIRTLGRFEVLVDGNAPGSPRKPAHRPLGMLKVLIAQGGCAVSEGVVIDALWPDLDGDHAHDARQVALHRLRKLLGSADAISVSDGRMFIDDELVWVDAFALETLCRNPLFGRSLERAQVALDLYQGAFLPQEIDAQWSTRMRECLRAKFVNLVARAASELEAKMDFAGAASLYERGLAVDDLENVLRAGLVRCLKKTGAGRVSQKKK